MTRDQLRLVAAVSLAHPSVDHAGSLVPAFWRAMGDGSLYGELRRIGALVPVRRFRAPGSQFILHPQASAEYWGEWCRGDFGPEQEEMRHEATLRAMELLS